jgi:apolipoprotein N-acyltransferase
MRRLQPLYPLVLALLVGGNVLYTFLATPVVFAQFERDLAGRVVAAMMPYYFGYGLALFLAANALFWLTAARRGGRDFKVSASLLAIGLVAAVAVALWLYPAMLQVRAQVASFAADAPLTGPRLAFRRLHGLSSALNLLLLGLGTALLLLAPRHAPGPEGRTSGPPGPLGSM